MGRPFVLRHWRRAGLKCVHLDPVPHAGDQKVDGNDLEEQVQAVVTEFFHQTKGNEKPELAMPRHSRE
jgi:hypothetical protein